jgi:hypothetical protein
MKKVILIVVLAILFALLPARAEELSAQPSAGRSGSDEVVTKTYTLRNITPRFVQEALKVYLITCSFGAGSNLISVVMEKKNVASFEEQLRRLDEEKKTILLRIFSVIAGKEGKNETIENKDLKRVLAEVSNLLSFKSYVLDGAATIMLKDGTEFGRVALSSSIGESLQFDCERIFISTGSGGKRSVKLGFSLMQMNAKQELLTSDSEIAENGYLVAGVSRIGHEGKSLVLVINAEIK